MAITLNCPKCGKPFRVRDDVIGLRVKCPSCAAILQVPAALSPASLLASDVPPEENSPATLLNAPIRPVQPPANQPRPTIPGPRASDPMPEPPRMGTMPSMAPPAAMPPGAYPNATMPQIGGMAPPQAMNPGMYAPPPGMPMPAQPMIPGPASMASNPGAYMGDHSPAASSAWSRVRRGLGFAKLGMFLLLIPAVAEIGKRIYLDKNAEVVDLAKPGFLGFTKLTFWQDLTLAYVAIPAALGYFLILVGRLLCMSAPSSSRTATLASWSFLCTLISLVGLLAAGYAFVAPLMGKSAPMPEILKLGIGVAIAFGVLAEIWSCLFQGQVGFVLGYPSIQRQIGMASLLIALTGGGILAANAFYPFLDVEDKELALNQVNNLIDVMEADKDPEASRPIDAPKADLPVPPAEKTETGLAAKWKQFKETKLVKAKEVVQEYQGTVTSRKHLPTMAALLFLIVCFVAMETVASGTRNVIRRWTALHPAM